MDRNIQLPSRPKPAPGVMDVTGFTALRDTTTQRGVEDLLASLDVQFAPIAPFSKRTTPSKSKQVSGTAVAGSWSVASRKRAARMGVPASALDLLLKDPG